MRIKILIIIFIILCICPQLALAGGLDVSSGDLIEKAGEYDGQDIVYTGEVIGDILSRGDYSWINVSDGSNAIGVWAATGYLQEVIFIGGYTEHGDTLHVTGIFNRACPEHGGDMDIHAQSIEIVQEGYAVSHEVAVWKMVLGPILFLGALVSILQLWMHRRRNVAH